MKKCLFATIILSLASVSFFTACKKEPTASKTTCAAKLYGYSYPDTVWRPATSPVGWGDINETTMATTTLATLPLLPTANNSQGVFNTGDGCYYLLRYGGGASTDTVKLLKVNPGGGVSIYTCSTPMSLSGLVHNRVTNKMYCLRSYPSGTSSTPTDVMEVTISGSTFSCTPLASTSSWYGGSGTVNNTTGEMYFGCMGAASGTYRIVKYTPGSGTTTLVASGTGRVLVGICYNVNDNMLYAMSIDFSGSAATPHELVRISPSAGTVATLAGLSSYEFNVDAYSTVIDPCSNRYILSTLNGMSWSTRTVKQFNISGTVVQLDTTAGFLAGLAIKD